MKKNFPVTDTETQVPEGAFIYSRTDLKGIVTEANDVYLEVSGFSREEMIGQSHNIVRHPDMPEAAFADLWRDLKLGLPWRGIVKNRRKDGGFYWVVANISPVREGGRIVGYQSVRSRPTRAQIEASDAAYRSINAGKPGLAVRHGEAIVRSGERHAKLRSFGFGLSLLSAGTLVGVLGAAFGTTLPLVVSFATAGVSLLTLAYFMMVCALPLRRAIDRQQHYLNQVLSTGDLSLQPERGGAADEMARQTGLLVSSLQSTLQGMANVASELNSVMERAGQSAGTMRVRCDEQSSSTASTAAALEEMTESLHEVAANSHETRQVAEQVGVQAKQGVSQAQNAQKAMEELGQTIHASVGQIEALSQRSNEIGRITSVIQEIADQTNLLALNASIEAARAGEAGRGFAVVADEVRKLAERTRIATEEIGNMIGAIKTETTVAVEGMRVGAEQINEGSIRVNEVSRSLCSIDQDMANTVKSVSSISIAADEQSRALSDIAVNMEQIAEATDGNLVLAQGAEGRAEELMRMANRMEKAVTQYKI
jgi:aerotaxis receptor